MVLACQTETPHCKQEFRLVCSSVVVLSNSVHGEACGNWGSLCKTEKPVLSLGEGGEMLLETGAKAEISEAHRSCSNPSQTG